MDYGNNPIGVRGGVGTEVGDGHGTSVRLDDSGGPETCRHTGT